MFCAGADMSLLDSIAQQGLGDRGGEHKARCDRQRLYQEVWTEPTRKVAQRYSVCDVAIAKACTLLDIPKPPRG